MAYIETIKNQDIKKIANHDNNSTDITTNPKTNMADVSECNYGKSPKSLDTFLECENPEDNHDDIMVTRG